MRTEVTERTIYKFEELPDNVKDAAIDNLYDINVDYGWWDYSYSEAEGLGFKITNFDTDHGLIDIELYDAPIDICKAILKDHGKTCGTYQLATMWLAKFLANALRHGTLGDDHDEGHEALIEEFIEALGREYLHLLRSEYEHLTSAKQIIESIEANEYEFTAEGKVN